MGGGCCKMIGGVYTPHWGCADKCPSRWVEGIFQMDQYIIFEEITNQQFNSKNYKHQNSLLFRAYVNSHKDGLI
jgi:hypothetical protein